ncbi:MAG TPA: O-antigen ligase family protein [Burkholderiales bacterium]
MNPVSARVFEASKLVALAPLAALLYAAWLAAWPRWRGVLGERHGAFRGPLLALGGFFVCALITTAASEAPWMAFFGNYFRREGLAAWLVAAGVCMVPLCLLRGGAQARRLLDALLLASVLPCVYALLQRYGYVAGTGGAAQLAAPLPRPGGSLGNPVFLGDYMLLLVPLALARLLALPAGAAWRQRAPWALLCLLQLFVLGLTQSRAPIAALLFALWLFGLLLAGLRGSRAGFATAAALPLVAGLALATLNLVPGLAHAAAGVPGLGRFVFTVGADLSGSSRLGIWEAGVETVRQAGAHLGFGYGFDTAYFHYFAHLPPPVLQIEGALETVDRLHNEVLELAASVGLAGLACYSLFIALLLRAADRALGGAEGRTAFWLYVLAPWPCGLLGGLLASAIGGIALAGVGAGLGAGAGWGALLAWRAWRLLRAPEGRSAPGPRAILVAALAATLLGFWLDAQISLPVMSTRMVFFALAALLLLFAAGVEPAPAPGQETAFLRDWPLRDWPLWGWGTGVVLAAALVACYPAPFGYVVTVLAFSTALAAPGMLILLLLVAWCGARAQAMEGGLPRALVSCAACALPALAGYAALAALAQAAVPGLPAWVLGAPVLAIWLWLAACCVAPAWRAAREERERQRGPGAPGQWRFAALAVVLLTATLYAGWAELRADVLVRLAGWAQGRGETAQAAGYVAQAAALVPREHQYHATMGTRRLERVAAQLKGARGGDPRQYLYLADELRRAEAEMREALARAPGDPWAMLGLANVLQFEGMTALRPLMGDEEGKAKAAQARAVFARAHGAFPIQTTVLRNWAQLEFDGGDAAAAYRLLDEMEALLPQSEAPYFERMNMARFAGDKALFDATFARAAKALPAPALGNLRQALQVAGMPIPAAGR